MPCHSLLSRDWMSRGLFLKGRAEEAAPLARGCEAKGSCCPGALLFPAVATQRTSESAWPLQSQLTWMRECFLRGSPGVAEGLQSHPLTRPNGPRLLSSSLAPASVTWLKVLLVVWTCRGTSLGALEPLDQLQGAFCPLALTSLKSKPAELAWACLPTAAWWGVSFRLSDQSPRASDRTGSNFKQWMDLGEVRKLECGGKGSVSRCVPVDPQSGDRAVGTLGFTLVFW